MCRADPDNTGYGYIFYISGDGFVAIFMNDEEDGLCGEYGSWRECAACEHVCDERAAANNKQHAKGDALVDGSHTVHRCGNVDLPGAGVVDP